jgi:universal stress protein A
LPAITRLLVPVDFSPSARAAVDYATFLAGKHAAEVTVLHVWEAAGYVGGDALSMLPIGAGGPPGWEQARGDVQREVELFLGKAGVSPRKTAVRVEAGEPSDTILRIAKEVQADLVVMGTHGRAGLSRLLIGSVAEAVLRRSTCPVLTIRVPSKLPRESVPL